MKNVFLLLAAVMCFSAQIVQAQITLTKAHMPVANLIFTNDQVEPNYEDSLNLGTAGPNQSWDFSQVPTINFPGSTYYITTAQTPQPNQFPSANLVSTDELSDTATYNYLNLGPTSFTQLGIASGSDVISFNPPFKSFQFPFTYQSLFTQTVQASGTSDGQSVFGTYSTAVVADAYGTVKTDLGTFPCLRVKRITELNLTVLFFNIIQRDTLFEWWTTQYKAPVFSYDRNSTDLLGQVDYGSFAFLLTEQAVPTGEPVSPTRIALQLAPNPTSGSSVLSFELNKAGKTEVVVMDAMGRLVSQYSLGTVMPGTYSQSIDLSNVAAGTYVAFLRQEGKLLGIRELVKE